MAIIFNNGVTNINSTPGINSDIFANRPAATDVATGTIFIATDTGVIYQSNGATWSTIGGGGGPTPGIDSVLAVGQSLTAIRTININSFGLLLSDTNNTSRFNDNGASIFNLSTLAFTVNTQASAKKIFVTDFTGVGTTNYFNIDVSNDIYQIGDFANLTNGNSINLDSANSLFYTQNNGVTTGLYFDLANDVYKFGRLNIGSNLSIEIDYFNLQTQAVINGQPDGFLLDFSTNIHKFGGIDTTLTTELYLQINQNQSNLFVMYANNDNGLLVDFSATKRFAFGDYQGIFNSTHIDIDDTNNTMKLLNSTTAGYIEFQANQLRIQGNNLQTNTSTGSSGQYLIIDLNGATYHIPLDNP